MPNSQIIVVGAGILGLSTAAELSSRGHSVTVVEHGDPHRLASGRSFSWLNSFGIAPASYHRLRIEGIERYRRLLPEATRWLAFPGSFNLIADVARAEHLIEYHAATGYAVQRIAAEKVARYEPALAIEALANHDILGARDEGWVDLPPYLDILRERITTAGGRFATDDNVRLKLDEGRIRGITLAYGETIAADTVIVAAGSGTPDLLSQAGFSVPQVTNNSLIVKVKPPKGFALRHVVRTPGVSIRPLGTGEIVLHSDAADKHVSRANGVWAVDAGVTDSLIAEVANLLAGRPKLVLSGTGVGLRPIPGDRFAVVGSIPGVEGLFTAFSHSAATLGPIIGELLAAEIAGDAAGSLLDDFRPARFASPSDLKQTTGQTA